MLLELTVMEILLNTTTTTPDTDSNLFLTELKEAIVEVNLIKAGKLTGRPAEELLDEL